MAFAQSTQPPASSVETQSGIQEKWTGSIAGTILDRTGAVVAGARIALTRDNQSSGNLLGPSEASQDQFTNQEALSGADGQFSFANVPPVAFRLIVTSNGFATHTSTGVLKANENLAVPQIILDVATTVTEVQVRLSQPEVAAEQVKEQEKQRVLGVIPNFYVSYVPDAVPLTSKQKFAIAWKTSIDPVTFVIAGIVAGVQQSQNTFPGYGQGAEGYGKRYGAAYADFVSGTFIGSAVLPSLLKQDPRYFYKGTGSKRSRVLYAIANSVICKGDNGRWQPNYSNILGNLAAGGISNLYYPEADRNGAGLTIENGLIGIGATAAANILQEFVIRKLTPNLVNHNQQKP